MKRIDEGIINELYDLLNTQLAEVRSNEVKLRLNPWEWASSSIAFERLESLLGQTKEEIDALILNMEIGEYKKFLISILNFCYVREHSLPPNVSANEIQVGDVCLIDYGFAYEGETGYQHPGLVISKYKENLFVIPMSKSREWIEQGRYFEKRNFCVGDGSMPSILSVWVYGLKSPSALFLHNAQYVRADRVLSKMGYIPVSSEIFRWIKEESKRLIFG